MVRPASDRITRVPPYSGTALGTRGVVDTGGSPSMPFFSKNFSYTSRFRHGRPTTPGTHYAPVCPLPLSLTTT